MEYLHFQSSTAFSTTQFSQRGDREPGLPVIEGVLDIIIWSSGERVPGLPVIEGVFYTIFSQGGMGDGVHGIPVTKGIHSNVFVKRGWSARLFKDRWRFCF